MDINKMFDDGYAGEYRFGENDHHYKIEVFNRYEDGETGTHVTIGEDGPHSVKVDQDISDNPSKRRHGIRIHFWSEHGSKFFVDIVQHKGDTYMSMHDAGEISEQEMQELGSKGWG
jgi:hypothetical protein